VPIGQAPQAIAYVPNAVPEGDGLQGLQQLGVAGQAAHLTLQPLRDGQPSAVPNPPTSVTYGPESFIGVLRRMVESRSGLSSPPPTDSVVVRFVREAGDHVSDASRPSEFWTEMHVRGILRGTVSVRMNFRLTPAPRCGRVRATEPKLTPVRCRPHLSPVS
jgi:hypothetical protein